MGRPKKYHTPEERLAANRAKSKRYYESYRKSINKKRRKEYEKSHKNSSSSHVEHIEPMQHIPASDLENWVQLSTLLGARLKKITSNDHAQFVFDICVEFIKTGEKDPIHQHVITLDKMQKKIYKFQDKILNLDGMSDNYRSAEAISKDVCKVIRWLEEVFCYAIVGIDEVAQKYSNKEFEFQSV